MSRREIRGEIDHSPSYLLLPLSDEETAGGDLPENGLRRKNQEFLCTFCEFEIE